MAGNILKTNQRGFTLTEVALIITILGLIIAPFFNFMTQEHKKEELVKVEANNEHITAALADFISENGHYPCPANYKNKPNDPAYGAAKQASSGTGCDTGANITLSNGVYYGALPTKSLNLPLEKSVNLFGWKYLYAVSAGLVDESTFDVGAGALTVKVQKSRASDTSEDLSNAQFVVVDPGKDGKGSASMRGADNHIAGFFACDGSTSADDEENCNTSDVTFTDKYIFGSIDPEAASYFDDQLIYTLARKADTHWDAPNLTTDGRMNLETRANGNLGLGNSDPSAKLHVSGGAFKVKGTNANLAADDLTVSAGLSADTVSANQAKADKGFFYTDATDVASCNGAWSPDPADKCEGETFLQTKSCGSISTGYRRPAVGTRDCVTGCEIIDTYDMKTYEKTAKSGYNNCDTRYDRESWEYEIVEENGNLNLYQTQWDEREVSQDDGGCDSETDDDTTRTLLKTVQADDYFVTPVEEETSSVNGNITTTYTLKKDIITFFKGKKSECEAPTIPEEEPAINGVCGSAHNTQLGRKPTNAEACQSGTVDDMDKRLDGSWDWKCDSETGDSEDDASCHTIAGVVAQCSPTRGQCLVGTNPDGNATYEGDGLYEWDCIQGDSKAECTDQGEPPVVTTCDWDYDHQYSDYSPWYTECKHTTCNEANEGNVCDNAFMPDGFDHFVCKCNTTGETYKSLCPSEHQWYANGECQG